MLEVKNPTTDEVIARVPRAGTKDGEKAIETGILGREEMRKLPAY
jgi:acyl-CoA reductase-like NAD-dependent aldehyde dehydrogenase